MTFQIVDDIKLPESTNTRNRPQGDFAATLNKLEVGQGFQYTSDSALKNMYPRVSPKKFGGKTFKVAQVSAPVAAAEGVEAATGVYMVKRLS
jgi:hypothetical protein